VKAYYEVRISMKSKAYTRAVDGISLGVKEGEVLGIVGESGCGKSTLANVMLMDIRAPLKFIEGEVILNADGVTYRLDKMSEEELRRKIWGNEIALIPQACMNALNPTLKIKKIILDIFESKYKNIDEDEVLGRAAEFLNRLQLESKVLDMYPFELSGGMKQRVTIAIATLLQPKLLIADEITSALDVKLQKITIKTLKELLEKHIVKSIVFITHDIAVVRQIATRIAVIYAGKLVEIGNTEDIIFNPLHPYSKALIGSVVSPEPEIRKRGLNYLPGLPPDLTNPPPGCRFHPRCPYAKDICRKQEPPETQTNNRQVKCWLYAKR